MRRGRQRDHTKANNLQKAIAWRRVVLLLIQRRSHIHDTASSTLLLSALRRYGRARRDYEGHLIRSRAIDATVFPSKFLSLSDADCLLHFRFTKVDIMRIVPIIAWPEEKTHTSRSRYRTTPLLSTCILLRRMASPCRWKDVEVLFGKHSTQLCELFWETVEYFLEARQHLLTGDITPSYMETKVSVFAAAVSERSGALDNCVGFIDGTVIGIARPGDSGIQNVVYNGHKRKHALKFQAVTTPDGMFAHVYGPLEGRRHDWTLYMRSDIDEQLNNALLVDGKQFCIYGDSGYNWRSYLEIPFQGAALSEDQTAFNKAMSGSRITVEWMFKEVKLYWTVLDFKRKLRIQESPVAALYLSGMLLCNIRNCIYPNETSQYFSCPPPSLQEFLNWKSP